MKGQTRKLILLTGLLLIMGTSLYAEVRYWKFPPSPPPERYGNLLIDRGSTRSGEKPVSFSHWMHRVHYTCRVCHSELGFSLETNTTEITEEDNRKGRFCGACHNDMLAFGHSEGNCEKCHSGDIDYGKEKFDELSALPSAAYGNEIDWVEAIDTGVITPKTFLHDDRIPVNSTKKLTIYSEWMWMYAHAQFSHEIHGRWLGCATCHPSIFNLELKTTDGFSMLNILNKKYCGTCHGKVAFPIQDCRRCHPTMRY